jgi:ABC-type transport system involved in multi-copper enzyme maturation permease subunit
MATSKKDQSEPIENKYIKEIQFGVLALVAGLGFFKVEDLKTFIHLIAQLIVCEVGKSENQDISVYFLSVFAILAYILYFFGFAFALITLFKNGKNFANAIFFSIASYFIMYFLLVILIFKGPYTNLIPENKKDSINAEISSLHNDSIPFKNHSYKDNKSHKDTTIKKQKPPL